MNTTNQTVGQKEKATQQRIIALFRSPLGYEYLGNWADREDNSNIEESLLRKYLIGRKYSDTLIARALDQLRATANNYHESLYTNNKNVYGLLRYGIKAKDEIGRHSRTVELIDWRHPEKNDFAIAEEVTILGNREKRPDVVLYVNGIALAVLELSNAVPYLSAMGFAKVSSISEKSLSNRSFPRFNLYWQEMIPRDSGMERSARPKNIF